MMWFFSILVVLAMGAVAAVAVGRGEPMVAEHVDRPDVLVPATGPLGAADLRAVRFPIVLRGYRMADVDALLDRLADEHAFRPETGVEATTEPQPEPAASGPEPTDALAPAEDTPDRTP